MLTTLTEDMITEAVLAVSTCPPFLPFDRQTDRICVFSSRRGAVAGEQAFQHGVALRPSAYPQRDDHMTDTPLHYSRQAIKKYVQANNNLSGVSDGVFTAQFNKALQKGSESGVFMRPKGKSLPTTAATRRARCDVAASFVLQLSALSIWARRRSSVLPIAATCVDDLSCRRVWPREARRPEQGCRQARCSEDLDHQGSRCEEGARCKEDRDEEGPGCEEDRDQDRDQEGPGGEEDGYEEQDDGEYKQGAQDQDTHCCTLHDPSLHDNAFLSHASTLTHLQAPAVEEKAPVVLGKTKSGRVTKSKAPQPVAKTIAPGKKAPAKKAASKKATPKKA